MTIPLVLPLPAGSSDLPGGSDGPPSSAPLFGLAPGGVYQAPVVTNGTGELLPHHFTLTPHMAGRYPFCGTVLLVAKTGRYPAPCPAEPGLSSPLLLRQSSGHLSCSNIRLLLYTLTRDPVRDSMKNQKTVGCRPLGRNRRLG